MTEIEASSRMGASVNERTKSGVNLKQ